MARDYYQIQVGYQIFQWEPLSYEWPPSWNDDRVLAQLRLDAISGGAQPELRLRVSDWDTAPAPHMACSPEDFHLSDGDPLVSGDILAYINLQTSNLVASPSLLGGGFILSTGAYAENDYFPYFVCNPGYYASGVYVSPSVRVQDGVFVIHNWTGEAESIPAGSCSLYWDDVNHKLKARDHSETDYTIGP